MLRSHLINRAGSRSHIIIHNSFAFACGDESKFELNGVRFVKGTLNEYADVAQSERCCNFPRVKTLL